jgi:peptidoglycan/xylan/chitin deacetylase (PgdA/CDA1 family)
MSITYNGNLRIRVQKNSTIHLLAYSTLILCAVFLATSCRSTERKSTPSINTPTPMLTLPVASPTTDATVTRPPVASVSRTALSAEATPLLQPTKRSVTLTSPLPTPTLSLLDLLTQTVVVTATTPVSHMPALTTPLSITEAVTHPTPPLAAQPLVRPPSADAERLPSLSAVTLTELHPDNVARTAHVPILMYHYVSTPPANADIYRRDLSVPPELFAAQLDRMHAEGYSTITLYDLIAYLQQGRSLPEKPVILTFDDGYRDNYENAFPYLRERQMHATFFIVIDFINRERPEYLTWDMVREMYAGGMSIEVHGIDHTTLRGRSRADLEFQALRSYETIQDRIGIRPRFLSYPAGEYDSAAIEIFRSANYWAGVTTIQGATQTSEKPFEMERIRIRNTTTPDELIRLLQLDW